MAPSRCNDKVDQSPYLIAKVSLFAADLYSFVLESERVWLGVLGEALAIGSGDSPMVLLKKREKAERVVKPSWKAISVRLKLGFCM